MFTGILNETADADAEDDATQTQRGQTTRPASSSLFNQLGIKKFKTRPEALAVATTSRPQAGDPKPSKQRERSTHAGESSRPPGTTNLSQPPRLSQSGITRQPSLALSEDSDDSKDTKEFKERPSPAYESAPAADDMIDVDEHDLRESSRELLRAAVMGASQSTDERSAGFGFLAENDFRRVELGMHVVS